MAAESAERTKLGSTRGGLVAALSSIWIARRRRWCGAEPGPVTFRHKESAMRMKMSVVGILGLCALFALAGSSASLASAADKAGEKQVDIKDVPAAARAAIEKEV